ncbi:MAG: hypothetical protein VKJ24_16525 [Synechococcales bacterium]|nr:hypothetical protein [Synechococcales bacterium]
MVSDFIPRITPLASPEETANRDEYQLSIARTVLMPAVLAASLVFLFLSSPLLFLKGRTTGITVINSLDRSIEGMVESHNRTVVIRYIGFAIVLSSIAGLTAAEVSRKLQTGRAAELPPQLLDWLQRFKLSSIDSSLAIPHKSEADPNELLPGALDEIPQLCRIRVPDQARSLFALQIGNLFYSLFRLKSTEQQAIAVIKRLAAKGTQAMMTQTDAHYAVWVWQPEAVPDLLSGYEVSAYALPTDLAEAAAAAAFPFTPNSDP